MTEITIEELEEIICYTNDWETLRAALESYTKYAWDSDLLEIQDNLVTIADDMSDARGMEELLAEVLEAVTQPVKSEDRRSAGPEFIVDIQHLREVVGLGNVYDSLQQLGTTNQRNHQTDIWERYGRQMLENLVLCEFARKVAQEYVRQRDESHARAAALELELELIAEEEAQQKTKKKKKKKKKKRKKTEEAKDEDVPAEVEPTALPPKADPVPAPQVTEEERNVGETIEPEMRSKEELSSEYNDSNPFAMFTDNPSSGKSAAKPTDVKPAVPEPSEGKKKKKKKKRNRRKRKNAAATAAGVVAEQVPAPAASTDAPDNKSEDDNTQKSSPSVSGDADTDSTMSALSISDDYVVVPSPSSDSRSMKRKRSSTTLTKSPAPTMLKPATAVAGSTPGGSPTRPTAQVQRGGSKPPGVGSPKNPKMKATSASESKPPIGAKNKARVVVKAKPDPTLARIPPPRPNPWAWITKYVDGMMFVCNSDTYEECLKIKLLGLPKQYLKNVQGLKAEQSALFLFNMSTRLLHGVFEPTESGGENLNRQAWNRSEEIASVPGIRAAGSRYPAQIPFVPVFEFNPLPEQAFRHMFSDGNRIRKLDLDQVSEILRLFIQHHTKRVGKKKASNGPVVINASSAHKPNPWKKPKPKTVNLSGPFNSNVQRTPSPTLGIPPGSDKALSDRSTTSPARTLSEESKEEHLFRQQDLGSFMSTFPSMDDSLGDVLPIGLMDDDPTQSYEDTGESEQTSETNSELRLFMLSSINKPGGSIWSTGTQVQQNTW